MISKQTGLGIISRCNFFSFFFLVDVSKFQKKLGDMLRRQNQTTFSKIMRKSHCFMGKIDHVIVDKPSGYHIAQFNDGLIRKDFFSAPKGLNCQNKACGLGCFTLVGSQKICKKCDRTGYPQNSKSGNFAVYCPIRSITLNPVMLLGLITRHSRGDKLSKDIFVRLTNMIIDRTR